MKFETTDLGKNIFTFKEEICNLGISEILTSKIENLEILLMYTKIDLNVYIIIQ